MRIRRFGIPLDALQFSEALHTITGWVRAGEKHHSVIVANVHLLTEAQENATLNAAFQAASLVVTDGMPLVWLARKDCPQAERIVGVELMEALVALGLRCFLLGGAEGVAEKVKALLEKKYPSARIVGTHCPPFRTLTPAELTAQQQAITAAAPDIVFVALGAPKQECWMEQHRKTLPAAAFIGVGAAFAYITGDITRAPRFMQVAGLEWLFRLCQEPRRLWRRYATTNWRFLLLVLSGYWKSLNKIRP